MVAARGKQNKTDKESHGDRIRLLWPSRSLGNINFQRIPIKWGNGKAGCASSPQEKREMTGKGGEMARSSPARGRILASPFPWFYHVSLH